MRKISEQFFLRLEALYWEPGALFLWAPLFLAAGIGIYLNLDVEPSSLLLIVGVGLACIGLVNSRARGFVGPFALVILGIGLGAATGAISGTPMLDYGIGHVRVQGTIERIEPRENGLRLILAKPEIDRLKTEQTPRKIAVTVSRQKIEKLGFALREGQKVSFFESLKPVPDPTVPGAYDFRRMSYFRGIGATGYAMGEIELVQDSADKKDVLGAVRKHIRDVVFQSMKGDEAALTLNFIAGDGTSLSRETNEAMRVAGLSHLQSISGLHVGLVGGMAFFVVRLLLALSMRVALRFSTRRIAAAMALPAIGFYTLLVGAPVPTQRSFCMMGLFFIGVILNRVSLTLRSVAVAALVVILMNPPVVLMPGFQLSFAAVTALIAVGEARKRSGKTLFSGKSGFLWKLLRAAIDGVLMSAVATLATLPFILFHFQTTGAYAVLANAVAIPLTAFWLMPLCVAAVVAMPVGLAAWPLRALQPGMSLLIALAKGVEGMPFSRLMPPPMPVSLFVTAVVGGALLCLAAASMRRVRLFGGAVFFVSIVASLAAERPDLLVAADGKSLGYYDKSGHAAIIMGVEDRIEKYAPTVWARQFGVELVREAPEADDGTGVFCEDQLCRGPGFRLLKSAEAFEAGCTSGVSLVVAPFDDRRCEQAGVATFNYLDFIERGARAVFWSGKNNAKMKIQAAREVPGGRPWTRGWAKAGPRPFFVQ